MYETSQLYAVGALKVACIGLQCVGFNAPMYRAILEQANKCAQSGKWRAMGGGGVGGLGNQGLGGQAGGGLGTQAGAGLGNQAPAGLGTQMGVGPGNSGPGGPGLGTGSNVWNRDVSDEMGALSLGGGRRSGDENPGGEQRLVKVK